MPRMQMPASYGDNWPLTLDRCQVPGTRLMRMDQERRFAPKRQSSSKWIRSPRFARSKALHPCSPCNASFAYAEKIQTFGSFNQEEVGDDSCDEEQVEAGGQRHEAEQVAKRAQRDDKPGDNDADG